MRALLTEIFTTREYGMIMRLSASVCLSVCVSVLLSVLQLLLLLLLVTTTTTMMIMMITSLPKVIWEEGRIAALSHLYAVKSPLVTMARPKFAPKNPSFRGPIPKPHYLPHPGTRPTYDAKRHPHPIRRFSTMHWTDRRTDRQIVHGKV